MSLTQANNYLAVNLHRLLAEEKKNVFFSPLSISTAMAMLVCASEGETESEMRAALGHDKAGIQKADLASTFEKYMSLLLENPDSYTLSCANSMLSQKGLNVKDGYKQILVESFKALLLEVDFHTEIEKAVKQINEWVKEKTKNMIPKFIETLNPGTVLVLLNAVYFKGTWLQKFEKKSTIPKKFFNGGSKGQGKDVNMMRMKKHFPFYEDETLQVLQLPYIGEEIAMLILLPRAIDGLESVESNLTVSFVEDLKKKLRKKKVNISLPRFKLEYGKSLVKCFQSLGVRRVFIPGAELGLAASGLAVDEIFHKAVLEVNEEGSEAAAATMISMSRCAVRYDPEFTADHPFAFVIYDSRSDLILFMGRVNEL